MTIKTSELTGVALDWAVAKCEGAVDFISDGITIGFELNGKTKVLADGWSPSMVYLPSTDWAQGGVIIEREGISVYFENGDWYAKLQSKPVITYYDYSPLVAAMRCYVASKLGEEVEVPDELLQGESKYV